LFYIYRNWIFR